MCTLTPSFCEYDKVETVREMPPNGEELPANTYLCYRGYDRRRKDFAPVLADGSLGRSVGRPPLDRSESRQLCFPAAPKQLTSDNVNASFRVISSGSMCGCGRPFMMGTGAL